MVAVVSQDCVSRQLLTLYMLFTAAKLVVIQSNVLLSNDVHCSFCHLSKMTKDHFNILCAFQLWLLRTSEIDNLMATGKVVGL